MLLPSVLHWQTCLSHQANKCCSVIKFKETLILLDAGLDMSPCLNFLPLPLVPSSHLNSLRDWVPRSFPADNQLENVSCCPNHKHVNDRF